MSWRVLLVEDDELIGTMVEMNLEQRGFSTRWERSAETALVRARAERFDLLILDLMLPGMDGVELAGLLRREGRGTPVLMLTARAELGTKLAALEAGADDYLVKPFDMEELLARAAALIRRGQAAPEAPAAALLSVAGGELDLDGRRFRDRLGREHPLSEREAEVLACFARHEGRTLTRADIIDEAWGLASSPTERSVDNFVLRLRRLVEDDPENPRHLETVRGRGYRYRSRRTER